MMNQQSSLGNQSNIKKPSEFSVQSTTITVNSESLLGSQLLQRVKSDQGFIKENKTISSDSMQMLKSALKSLELNPSQQQIVVNQVTQFIQQNKQRTVRSISARKNPPIDLTKKIPPVNKLSKEKRSEDRSKQKPMQIKSESLINSLIKPINYRFIPKEDFEQISTFSSIIKTQQDYKKLVEFFSEKSLLNGFSIVFKASENQFSIRSFFNLCGNMNNLLILCKTNRDKVIGAYSPLHHQHGSKMVYDDKWGQKVKDSSKTSFIFSLTNNQKFPIKNEAATAVYRWRDKKYLMFGDWQFAICDCSNKNLNSRTDNLGLNFYNQKYKSSKESWLKFNGNEQAWFTTKQWEVWKVDSSLPRIYFRSSKYSNGKIF